MAARLIPVLAALALGLALGCGGVSPVQVPVPTPNPVPAPRLPPTSPSVLGIFGAATGVGGLPDRSVSGRASTPPPAPDWNAGPELRRMARLHLESERIPQMFPGGRISSVVVDETLILSALGGNQ